MAEARGVERRRGLINFLTWAFFLGEVLGRDGLAPSSAHAAEAEEAPSSRGGEGDAAPHQMADRPLTAIGDPGESAAPVSTGITSGVSAGPGSAANSQAGALEAGSFAALESRGGAADGGAGRSSTPAGSDDPAPETESGHDGGASPTPAATPSLVGSGADDTPSSLPLIDVSLSPDGLVKEALDTVHALPVVGSVVGAAVDAVAAVVDGLGNVLTPAEPMLASDGLIVFEGGMPLALEIETPHGFTDFGIALGIDLGGASALPASFAGTALEPLLALAQDTLPDVAEHGGEAAQRASADVLG